MKDASWLRQSAVEVEPGLTHLSSNPSFDGFELTFLGTSSQGCGIRRPSSLALRLRAHTGSHLWLFDAGEGALAQLQSSHLRIRQLRKIFITHMHSDHIHGLPGIVMSSLSVSSESAENNEYPEPLTVYGPPGIKSFLRSAIGTALPYFRDANLLQIVELAMPEENPWQKRCARSSAYWNMNVKPLPFEATAGSVTPRLHDSQAGQVIYDLVGFDTDRLSEICLRDVNTTGDVDNFTNSSRAIARHHDRRECPGQQLAVPATVQAGLVLHTVPCVAYVICEDLSGLRFDKEKLAAFGFPTDGRPSHRRYFQRLVSGRSVEYNGRVVHPKDVSRERDVPRRLCIVGDTSDASGIANLATDVDVLVHEATVVAADSELARKRGHSSSRSAAMFAKRIRAKRTVLNHVSVGYSAQQVRSLESEARAILGRDKVYVAHDMSVFNVPYSSREDPDFEFRAHVGNPRWDRAEQVLQEEKVAQYRKQAQQPINKKEFVHPSDVPPAGPLPLHIEVPEHSPECLKFITGDSNLVEVQKSSARGNFKADDCLASV